jgi:sphinganine-1-phosphate aldolase
LLAALEQAVTQAQAVGPVQVAPELAEAAQALDPALLDVAPPRLREALLIAFLDRLMRPT